MNLRRTENEGFLSNANVKAFLETLSKSEGTNDDYSRMVFGTVINSPLFPKLIGQRNVRIPDLSRFPCILVKVNDVGLESSAAGKFQIIKATYESVAPSLEITDFQPHSQDLIALELIRRRGALTFIMKGDIAGALTNTTLRKEWASLTGAGYGQHENKLSQLVAWFNAALESKNV